MAEYEVGMRVTLTITGRVVLDAEDEEAVETKIEKLLNRPDGLEIADWKVSIPADWPDRGEWEEDNVEWEIDYIDGFE